VLTAGEIVEGARRLGVRLVTGVYWDPERRCGCAAAVAALLECPDLEAVANLGPEAIAAAAGEGPAWVEGVVDGFEGYRMEPGEAFDGDDELEDYAEGYGLGEGVRALCLAGDGGLVDYQDEVTWS
jgi:hypothetical protein